MSFIKSGAFGGIIGFLNGLLGAGGGMVAVPVLKKEMDTKQAHATSIAVIIPMSIFSAASYLFKGSVTIQDAFPYIPGGIAGALLGIYILKRIKPKFIKKVFALVMLWAGSRMVFA